MRTIALSAMICASARADVMWSPSPGLTIWSGGSAWQVHDTMWVGNGWEYFPGVNPPWNPIVQPGLVLPPPGAPVAMPEPRVIYVPVSAPPPPPPPPCDCRPRHGIGRIW